MGVMKHAVIALMMGSATGFVAKTCPMRAHVLRAEEGAPEPVAEVAAAEEKPKRADKSKATPLADLVEGNEYAGKITGLAAYGAFVDIGAQSDGLVHISRVSDSRVEDLQAELSVGDEVKVRIIDVDLDKATLGLAMNTYRDPTAPPRPGRDGGTHAPSPPFPAPDGPVTAGPRGAPQA